MDANAVWAIVGSVVLAFIVRFANIVIEWLARVLGTKAPEPIPLVRQGSQGAPPVPDPGRSAQNPVQGDTGANPGT